MILKKNSRKILIIGAGIAGLTTALKLVEGENEVSIADPILSSSQERAHKLNGSQAALGILMGNIFHRSKGRGWDLRKRSMELWPELLNKISTTEEPIEIQKPLVKIASSIKEAELLLDLAKKKNNYDIKFVDDQNINDLSKQLGIKNYGSLISFEDGRIDNILLLKLILKKLDKFNINKIPLEVKDIEKNPINDKFKWKVTLENEIVNQYDLLVICSSLRTRYLLNKIGSDIIQEPILGQVMELEYDDLEINNNNFSLINTDGVNIIFQKNKKIIIGATIEQGLHASKQKLEDLKRIFVEKDKFIERAKIIRTWSGIRAKPIGNPAPLLRELGDGLFINTGHYRNGILLAPASAEIMSNMINH